jgi:hypothetical protein
MRFNPLARPSSRLWGLVLSGGLAAVAQLAPAVAHAVPIAFKVDGVALNSVLGFTSGQVVSFTYVLDDQRPLNVRVSPSTPYPASACCGGQFAWRQDLPTQSHLWSALSGTGLSGQWDPTANPKQQTTSALALWLGTQPSQTLDLQAFDNAGTNAATGVTVHGLQVTGFQVQSVFKGLNALSVYGQGLFSAPVPHPNDLFAGIAGTYLADEVFTNRGALWALGSPTLNFRATQLTISPVPEPDALALYAAGALVCAAAAVHRRRRIEGLEQASVRGMG